MTLSIKHSTSMIAAVVLALLGLTAGTVQAADPISDLPVSAASYFGGGGADEANGVAVTPDGPVLTAGALPGDNPDGITTTTLGSLPAGDGVVLRLAEDGQSILSLTRVGDVVNDIQANGAGDVVICGDFGVAVTNQAVDALTWADDLGGETGDRCAIGEDGTVAVMIDVGSSADRIEVFDAGGTDSASWDSGSSGRHYYDVTVDAANDLVIFTGYDQKTSNLQVAFLTAYGTDGTPVWNSYDYAASAVTGANLAADSRGRRVNMGADGLLYFAATVDGGNAIFNRDPKNIGTTLGGDVVIKTDEYNDPFNLSGAKTLTWYGRFNPATGDILLGQFLLTRLSSGGGNSISPRGIAADAEGRVFLTGQAFASIENRDTRQVNGITVGSYGGGEVYLFITEPDFQQRTVWTPFVAPNQSGGGSSGSGVEVRGGTVAMTGTLSLEEANRGLITVNAFDDTTGGAGEGYVVVLPNVGGPGVAINESGGSTVVQEGGTGDSYTVQLTTEPSGAVTVSANFDISLITVSPATLTFTPSDWDQPQTVTVEAVDNDTLNTTDSAAIAHTVSGADYDSVLAPSVTVTIVDDENLVANGGFEAPYSSADWVLVASGGNGDGRFSPPPAYLNEGDYVALFVNNRSLDAVLQTVDGLSGSAGDTVTLSFDYGHVGLSSNGFIGGRFILRNTGGEQQVVNCIITERSTPTVLWTPYTCDATAEIAYDSITVILGALDVSGGLFAVDAVQLTN